MAESTSGSGIGQPLTRDTWREYFHDRSITDETLVARGVVWRPGRTKTQPDAIRIPLHGLGGGDEYQLRLAAPQPDRTGKLRKFRTPSGQRNVLITSPLIPRTAITDGAPSDPTLWIVEGVTRVDVLAQLGIPSVGLLGIWNWRGRNGPIADWSDIHLRDRPVIIVPDGDVASNRKVHTAVMRLKEQLEYWGAGPVGIEVLPGGADGIGLDDFVTANGITTPDDLVAALHGTLQRSVPRPAPREADVWKRLPDWFAMDKSGYQPIRYVTETGSWWQFDGVAWRRFPDAPTNEQALIGQLRARRFDDAAAIAEALGEEAASEWTSHRGFEGHSRTFMYDLRDAAARDAFDPPITQIATPTGVVDIPTGLLKAHSPQFDTLGVTQGRYLPMLAEDLERHLKEHIKPTFGDDESFRQFIELVGLAVSGFAPLYRGLVALTGASGAGKGAILRLIDAALGDRGTHVAIETLLSGRDAAPNPALARIIETRPLFVGINEVGPSANVDIARLLQFTGGDDLQARYLNQNAMLSAPAIGQLWITTIQPPRIRKGMGIERRLAVLEAPRPVDLPDAELRRPPAKCLQCRDAVVTLAIDAARRVGSDGWTNPAGNADAKDAFMAKTDELGAWCDALEADDEGLTIDDLLNRARRDLADDKLSARALVPAIRLVENKDGSKRWDVPVNKEIVDGKRKDVRRLSLIRQTVLDMNVGGLSDLSDLSDLHMSGTDPPVKVPLHTKSDKSDKSDRALKSDMSDTLIKSPKPTKKETCTQCRAVLDSPEAWAASCPNDEHGNHRVEVAP